MSLRQGNPNGSAASSDLDTYMSAIESMPNPERWLAYQKCAKHLLIRHLVAQKKVQEPINPDDPEECRPFDEECVAQNADGVCYLFLVRGRVWDVILTRNEESRKILKKNPERLNDADLFKLDLSIPADICSRDSDFGKK